MSTRVEVVAVSEARPAPGSVGEVARLAYPAVLQTLSDTLMQTVDSAMVGRLGTTELGAVGFGGIWLWTTLTVFVGASTGVQTFVAQDFGARAHQRCGGWVWQGTYALLPAALLWFAFVALAFKPLLALLGPSAAMQDLAAAYAYARLFGAPAIIVNVVVTSYFRGLGDTRTPLVATVIANLVNVVFTYGLVFGRLGLPALGVAGAGAGTAIANYVYLGIVLSVLLRPAMRHQYGTTPVRPALEQMRRFVRTSAPIGGQWFLDMASFAVFSTVLARMGDTAMAASQAMIQLLSLSFMQAFGLSIAAGALVGRYVGARDLEAAERSHHSALKLGLALAAAVAALFIAVPEVLLGVFSTDPAVLALGRPLLILGAVFQLCDAVGIIVGGSLRGAGDTRWPFVVQASAAWAVRLPFVYVCAVALDGGVLGAWIGELGYVTVLGVAWWVRFRAGVWRTMRI